MLWFLNSLILGNNLFAMIEFVVDKTHSSTFSLTIERNSSLSSLSSVKEISRSNSFSSNYVWNGVKFISAIKNSFPRLMDV